MCLHLEAIVSRLNTDGLYSNHKEDKPNKSTNTTNTANMTNMSHMTNATNWPTHALATHQWADCVSVPPGGEHTHTRTHTAGPCARPPPHPTQTHTQPALPDTHTHTPALHTETIHTNTDNHPTTLQKPSRKSARISTSRADRPFGCTLVRRSPPPTAAHRRPPASIRPWWCGCGCGGAMGRQCACSSNTTTTTTTTTQRSPQGPVGETHNS